MRQGKRTMLLLAAAIALCPQQAGAATELAAPPIEDSAVTGWTNAAEARPTGATATPHAPAVPAAQRPGQSIPLDLNDMAAQAKIPRVAPAAPLQDKPTAALPLIDWLRADTAMNLIRWLVILAIATLAGAGLRRRHASSNA